jgi:hypothetical protein
VEYYASTEQALKIQDLLDNSRRSNTGIFERVQMSDEDHKTDYE